MAIRRATAPPVLYRIGRTPDPLAWPPRAFSGGGRFDHPRGAYLVLYTAEQRHGAFLETLDSFRPSIETLAAAARLPDGEPGDLSLDAGVVPEAYFRKRIARLRLLPNQAWLDLRSPETHHALRLELADALMSLGYPGRFVWGDLLGQDHGLTRAIGQRAHAAGFEGIAYASCHDASLSCWALFDRAMFEADGEARAIDRDDLDLVAACNAFGLTISR